MWEPSSGREQRTMWDLPGRGRKTVMTLTAFPLQFDIYQVVSGLAKG